MSTFLPVANPVAFTIAGFDIMWYGLCIVAGMVTALLISYYRAEKFGLSKDRMLDVFLTVMISGVIGARIYYVIFEWERYAGNWKAILNMRNGGLAIHGGLILGILALYIACKFVWKEDIWRWLDLLIPGLPLAQAIGRWGNYFNSEAHGGPTELPWAIECDGQLVHPTFLYESLWCLVICIVVIIFIKKGRHSFDGQLFLLYTIMYSVERIAVEQLRTDSLMLGSLKQAQIISFVFIIIALTFWYMRKDVGLAYVREREAAAAAAATEAAAATDVATAEAPVAEAAPAAATDIAEASASDAAPAAATDIAEASASDAAPADAAETASADTPEA